MWVRFKQPPAAAAIRPVEKAKPGERNRPFRPEDCYLLSKAWLQGGATCPAFSPGVAPVWSHGTIMKSWSKHGYSPALLVQSFLPSRCIVLPRPLFVHLCHHRSASTGGSSYRLCRTHWAGHRQPFASGSQGKWLSRKFPTVFSRCCCTSANIKKRLDIKQ